MHFHYFTIKFDLFNKFRLLNLFLYSIFSLILTIKTKVVFIDIINYFDFFFVINNWRYCLLALVIHGITSSRSRWKSIKNIALTLLMAWNRAWNTLKRDLRHFTRVAFVKNNFKNMSTSNSVFFFAFVHQFIVFLLLAISSLYIINLTIQLQLNLCEIFIILS